MAVLSLTLGATDGLPQPRRALAIAAVLAATVLVVLDAAIANVALPTIAPALQVTPAASVWVMTAYQTALVMALLPCAALGESRGYRPVFLAGVAVFTAASGLCALAPSLPWLAASRFLQGLGGAAIMALGVALLRFAVPQDRLGAAIGWNALAVALGSAAGPAIGAAILSVAGWPWLFAVNLPLGAAILFASNVLPAPAGTARRLDRVSVALNAGAFAGLVLGAEALPTQPLLTAAAFAGSALTLVALVRRELPRAAPLIPLDLLRLRSFRISVIASITCFTGQTAGLVALPFLLQHGLGLSAWTTGLYMTPWPLTVALAGPIAGCLVNRIPTALLCAAGGMALALGLAAAALWPLAGAPQPLLAITALCGLGFGLFQVPNNRSMFLAAPRARSGAAGGLQGTARLTGQTAGAILMSLLFSLSAIDAAPRLGLAIGAVLTLAAGLASLLHGVARPR